MSKESLVTGSAENQEHKEIIEHHHESLKVALKEQADKLRKDGFDVDDDARISVQKFKDFFSANTFDDDVEAVRKLDASIDAGAKTEEGARVRGEVLEMAKTIIFNSEIFGGRLVALRTTKYDDYKNGVDEMIIDRQTGEAMAALDTTTDLSSKMQAPAIMKRVAGGCRVKYGLKLDVDTNQISRYTHNRLPLFIISVSIENLAKAAQSIVTGVSNEYRKELEEYFKSSFVGQAKAASDVEAINVNVRAAYSRVAQIFDSIK
ncbi:MAG: hypothetical protein Q8O87_01115 [bacterium]|nr:hypothetical protein [bacterium]